VPPHAYQQDRRSVTPPNRCISVKPWLHTTVRARNHRARAYIKLMRAAESVTARAHVCRGITFRVLGARGALPPRHSIRRNSPPSSSRPAATSAGVTISSAAVSSCASGPRHPTAATCRRPHAERPPAIAIIFPRSTPRGSRVSSPSSARGTGDLGPPLQETRHGK